MLFSSMKLQMVSRERPEVKQEQQQQKQQANGHCYGSGLEGHAIASKANASLLRWQTSKQ